MKILYLECNMGAAGDMLMGALADLFPDRQAFTDRLNNLGIPGVHVDLQKAVKCGIVGTHAEVTVNGAEEESLELPSQTSATVSGSAEEHHHHVHHHPDAALSQGDAQTHSHTHIDHENGDHEHSEDPENSAHIHAHAESSEESAHVHSHSGHTHHSHEHHGMTEIAHLIEHLEIPEQVKEDVKNIYSIIAEAEASVHGRPVSEIHFHEVGTADALADITGCALLMREIGAGKIVTSPVNVGYGQVRCAHGILPVPAPATARILEGIPCYAGPIEGELCTPTGAAILKYYTDEYRRLPQMIIRQTGYGMGKKDFPAANCVRAVLGESLRLPCFPSPYSKPSNCIL